MFPEALVKSWTINGSETERRAFNVTVWVGGRSGAVEYRWKSCNDSPWQGSPFVSVPMTGALRYERALHPTGRKERRGDGKIS